MTIEQLKVEVEQAKRMLASSQREHIKALQDLVRMQADRITRLETDLARSKALALAQVYHPIAGG